MKKMLFCLCLLASAASADSLLRFSWWGGSDRLEATQHAIRLFEARNPGVRIRAEPSAWAGYFDRLEAQINANAEPDIMQINWAWLSALSRTGDGFYDLYRAGKQLRLEEFPGDRYRDGMVQRKLNGLPVSYTARVFLWNKTVFDRAGIEPPRSWDQLLAAGKLFQEKLGSEYFPLDADDLDALLLSYAYMMQRTGKPYIYGNQARIAYGEDEALLWVRFYRSLYEHHVLPHFAQRQASGGIARPPEQQPDWVNGRWGGLYVWDSQLRSRANALSKPARVEVGEFIVMNGARNSGMLGRPTMLLAVGRNRKQPEIAARFINFMLTDPDAIKLLGTTRGIPLTRTAQDTLQKTGQIEPYELRAYEQIRAARIEFPSPYFENPEMLDFLLKVFEKVALKKISDQEAATELLTGGQQLLAKLK